MTHDIRQSLIRSLLLPILGWFWFAGVSPTDASEPWRSILYPEDWQRPGESSSFYNDMLIQDYSFAGYKRGEEPIPIVAGPVFDGTSYGADPTGVTDSTGAIQNAINAAADAGGGVVFLPAGEYRISPQGTNSFCLRISTSNVVLRGAGMAETFLLNTSYEMNGKSVVLISPPTVSTGTVRNITADLPGPARRIPVENADSFAPGDFVRIEWEFTSAWIAEHNQQTWWNADTEPPIRPANARYLREVLASNPAEGWIELDVPSRYSMKTRDNANVRRINGLLSGVGVESLAIGNLQHPGSGWGENDYTDPTKAAYDTHNSWLIRLSNIRDSWITDVHSRQAATNTSTCHMLSNGISLINCLRITVRDTEMGRPQYGGGGGNGYMFRVQHGNECLIRNCIADFSRHGFVISHAGTSGNVFLLCEDRETQRATGSSGSYNTSGSGSDNHMHFSHSNLWDRCHAHNSFYTASHRGFSGTTPHGLSSAHGVYWNTSGSGTRYTDIVRSAQARYGYVIGTSGSRNGATNATTGNTAPADHLEGIGLGTMLEPASLYLDQLSRRLEPTLVYNANGATSGSAAVDANSPYAPGETATVLGPGDLMKTGFAFSGWNTAPDGSGTSHVAGSTLEITVSTILYAQWTGATYTVSFVATGGSPADPAEKLVEFGASYGTLATSTRPGFSFVGWFTAPTGGSEVTATTTVTITEEQTLYARWNALPVVDAGPDQTVELSVLAPWTPALMNAAAWYDAADTSSIGESLGEVYQWDDKSGNDKHLSQDEPTRQPTTGIKSINGRNVLDLAEDYIFTSSGLGADIRSVFMVTSNNVAITSSTPTMILLSTAGDGISTGDGYGSSTGALLGEVLSVFDEDTTSFSKRQAASSSTLPMIEVGAHLFTYALDLDWFVGLDGSDDLRDLTSGASRNPMLFADSFSIGAAARQHPGAVEFFYDGSVAEVILLDTTVSQEDRRKVEGYLAHKWGLVGNLPAVHPYKALAPEGLMATVTLNGTVSDPEADDVSSIWSVVSGPGPVMLTSATESTTDAAFAEEGVYVLRLTTTDGFGSSFDDLVVTVNLERFLTVTYDGNGSTGGLPPVDINSPYSTGSTVSVLDAGDLVKTGHSFAAWNTAADGTGTDHAPGSTFIAGDPVTLYARWNAHPEVDAGPDRTVVINELVPWTPAKISTAAWYDASDAGSLTEIGGLVSQWNDKSGNNNHASQANETRRPTTGGSTINGLNAISFNPYDDQYLAALDDESLDLDASGGANVFAVANYTGYINRGSGLNSILSKGELLAASAAYGIRVNSGNMLLFKAAAELNIAVPEALTSQNIIFGGTRVVSTNTASVYMNGEQRNTGSATSGSSDNESPLVIGGEATTSRCADVRIGEILVIPGELTAAGRQGIEGYLAHKWALAGKLPADHPYKATAPGTLVASATLSGTVTDAEDDVLSHTWSVVSGPEGVTFSDASALDATARFTEAGIYTLRLTSSDGFSSTSDELMITVGSVTVPSAFEIWAGAGEVTFTGDANGDGVADGMAWLLGAGDPAEDAMTLLPTALSNIGALEVDFTMLNQSNRGGAVLKLQYGTDLGIWNTVTVPDESGTHGGVDFAIIPNGDNHEVKATIPASAAGTAGRLFMRLSGELATP